MAHLEQAEPNRADSAAALLGTHADVTVLPALWKRIESMEASKLTEGTAEANLHVRIRQTIATAKGWTLTKQALKRLGPLCFDKRCTDEVKSYIQRWNNGKPAFVLWSHAPNGEVTGWIGQYGVHSVAELKQKMLLPPGTVLVWGTEPDDVDATMLAEVSGWAKERDVILQRPVPGTVSP